MLPSREAAREFALALALATSLGAQIPQAGFAATAAAATTLQVPLVRAFAVLPNGSIVLASGSRLQQCVPGNPPRVLFDEHSDDIAALAVGTAPGEVVFALLRTGKIRWYDTNRAQIGAPCVGVPNTFAIAALANGDLLLQANPTWPATGAHTGIWLVGPSRTPREILPLVGPSGPMVVDRNGDLIVAELGAIVPPPPGAARLLRFPAAKLQQAVAGATLSVADAVQQGTGFAGIYALAVDDRGALHVSDPASAVVLHCDPGSLSPNGTSLDVGNGTFALGMQFAAGTGAPFVAYQPAELAGALFVAHTDFWSRFEVLRLAPARARLASIPAGPLPPGPAAIAIEGAPAGGFAVLAATFAPTVAERVVTTLAGAPMWSALAGNAPLATQVLLLDAQGRANTPFPNPGGYAVDVSFQAVVLGTSGIPSAGTSTPLVLHLLP